MTAAGLVLCVALAAPRVVAPPADPPPPADAAELAERLQVAFGMIHGGPSAGFWRALGAGAVSELDRVARDAEAMPSRRARALEGLSHVGGDRAAAALRDLSAAEGLPFSVRAAAMEGAGRLLSPTELSRLLKPVLEGAARPADRAVAAEVLAARGSAAGCAVIRAQVSREPPAIRPAFHRALSGCDARGR